jgi:hypothetical protein
MAITARGSEDPDRSSHSGNSQVNASTTALVFVGLLLTAIGLFVAGSIALIGLGVASLFGAALFQTIANRSH